MTDLRKAAEQALEALECAYRGKDRAGQVIDAIVALEKALAQPEQAPVAWAHIENNEIVEFETDKKECEACEYCVPLYTAPPKKEWVGLSDDEREHFRKLGFVGVLAVENKLKEKNS